MPVADGHKPHAGRGSEGGQDRFDVVLGLDAAQHQEIGGGRDGARRILGIEIAAIGDAGGGCAICCRNMIGDGPVVGDDHVAGPYGDSFREFQEPPGEPSPFRPSPFQTIDVGDDAHTGVKQAEKRQDDRPRYPEQQNGLRMAGRAKEADCIIGDRLPPVCPQVDIGQVGIEVASLRCRGGR